MKKIFEQYWSVAVLFLTFMYIGWRCAMVSVESPVGPLGIVIAVGCMYIDFLIQVILHEAGHLAFGLLTGYKYVSFRIGSLVWIKDQNNKLAMKHMKIQGTGGQCLLCPPDVEIEKCPYKLYHLGGGLVNLVVGGIAILLAILLPKSLLTYILCEEFGVIGLALGLTNLIPAKSGGMQNDGYNLLDLSKNMDAKRCINLVLTINALMTVADSYDDLPQDIRDEIKSIDFSQMDITNSSVMNAYNYQAAIYYSESRYRRAYEIQKDIMEKEGVLPIFQNEAKCECLFYELTHGAEKEKVDTLYDTALQKYVKATALYPSRQRLLFTYYTLFEKDEEKASGAYEKLEKLVETYMIKADAKLELEVAKKVRDGVLSDADEVEEDPIPKSARGVSGQKKGIGDGSFGL